MIMLQLERYFYPHISVIANPEFKKKQGGRARVDLTLALTEVMKEERRWEVSLTIKTAPQNNVMAYQIELESVGIFKVAPEFPEKEIEPMVRIAGGSMLYSAAREYLLVVTSRGPFGGVSLPTASFQEMKKRVKKEEKVEPKQEEAVRQ